VTTTTPLGDAKAVLYTYAEGLMSRLAHDLALEAIPDEARVLERTETGGRAELVFAVSKIKILGAVRKDVVDPAALSESDRRDIQGKITDAIGAGTIRATVAVEGGSARVSLTLPCGAGTASFPIERDADAYRGRARFSLKALGVKPVKGPMNAFRLSDRLEVVIEARAGAEG
jgi:hypothetical protein